jgi:hypothetical protein
MAGLRSAWSRVGIVALGLICGAARDESRGQDITPDRIGFGYETIRRLLPEDGKLIEKGVIPRNYVGFALGHEVKADGRRVFVRSKLGSPGVVLGEGYIKLHLGAHVEQEPLGSGPTLAFNIVAGVILTVDDQLKVTLEVPDDDLRIEGDNWGGRAVAALKRDELRRIVRREIEKHAEPLTELLRGRRLHPKLKAVSISPAGIEIAKSRPEPPKAAEAIVEAELHFHTTSDDREGGFVKVEFYSNEATKIAEVGPLPEKPEWGQGDRRTISHEFPTPIPLPESVAFARISLTEGEGTNIGWNFEATLTLKTDRGRSIVFEGKDLLLDAAGKRRPRPAVLNIPRVR